MNDDAASAHPRDHGNDTSSAVEATLVENTSQFGILDLILFTTGVAVGFTAVRNPSSGGGSSFNVMSVLYSLLSGATLGAFFLLIRQRIRLPQRFSQPGVLLLIVGGFETLLVLTLFRLHSMFFRDSDEFGLVPGSMQTFSYVLLYAIVAVAVTGLLIWGICRVSGGWKAVLLLCAVGRIATAASLACLLFRDVSYRLMSVASVVNQLALLFALIACIICMVNDAQRNLQRSLMHWLGIASFVVFALMPFVQMLLTRIFTAEQLYGV